MMEDFSSIFKSDVAYSTIGDKTYIEDLHAYVKIMALRPVSFAYKKDINKSTYDVHYGLVPEEAESIYPALVKDNKIQFNNLTALLLSEIQSQRVQLLELDKRLSKLEGNDND